jgi:hypothetical protein
MATAKKPFRLDADGGGAGTRDVLGRFARPDATPANPLAEKKPASNDQQTMSGWAPGIGKGSAQLTGQNNPYPPIEENASTQSRPKVS